MCSVDHHYRAKSLNIQIQTLNDLSFLDQVATIEDLSKELVKIGNVTNHQISHARRFIYDYFKRTKAEYLKPILSEFKKSCSRIPRLSWRILSQEFLNQLVNLKLASLAYTDKGCMTVRLDIGKGLRHKCDLCDPKRLNTELTVLFDKLELWEVQSTKLETIRNVFPLRVQFSSRGYLTEAELNWFEEYIQNENPMFSEYLLKYKRL